MMNNYENICKSQTEVEGIYKYSGPIYFKFQRVNELICVILKLQLLLSRKEHMIWGWEGRYYIKWREDPQFVQTAFVASDEQIIRLGTYTDLSSDITIF